MGKPLFEGKAVGASVPVVPSRSSGLDLRDALIDQAHALRDAQELSVVLG
ncbi:MAG: hypothetical protein GY772_06525 [bacterium]|nr:hypothetical protein [bacterium]